jgi:hypothetical protein
MIIRDNIRSNHIPVSGVYRFTRNNKELAGVLVYLFAIAIFFAGALIVMVFRTADEPHVRAALDHRANVIPGQRFHRG